MAKALAGLRCAVEARTLQNLRLELSLGYNRAGLLRLTGEQGYDNDEIDDDVVAFACALSGLEGFAAYRL